MFCDYCRRLFEFRQPVSPYEPPEKRVLGNKQGSGGPATECTAIQQRLLELQKLELEIYGDVQDIFKPRHRRWMTPVGKEGLKIGATHAPGLDCQVCDMIFSNISPSLVQALLRKAEVVDGESSVSFVYELTNENRRRWTPEAVLSVWLGVSNQLLPMIKLKINNSTNPESQYLTGEANTTGSTKVLDLAASWLQSCSSHHRGCSYLNRPKYCLPTRLVDVGTKNGSIKPHLWVPGKDATLVPYMTLSYHWLKNPGVLLTKDSLPALCQEIPLEPLSKSIQDAIQITRYLGIRYLWIDALCIIQDYPTDWEIESATMGNVYKFSYCTISASSAMSEGEGCFVTRGSLQAHITTSKAQAPITTESGRLTIDFWRSGQDAIPPRCALPYDGGSPSEPDFKRRRLSKDSYISGGQRGKTAIRSRKRKELTTSDESGQIIDNAISGIEKQPPSSLSLTIRTFQEDLWAAEVDMSPLSRRAWTLQERLLSPRILHFGKRQVFWECKIDKACETWPEPKPKIVPTSQTTSRSRSEDFISQELYGITVDPLHEHWDEIVEAYTDANLTKAEDKLVAISGLAKEIFNDTKDAYYAGHWRKDFIRGLFWYVQHPKRTGITAYRAPSWSWASVDGKVTFLVRRAFKYTNLCKFQTARTVGIDGTSCSTGQIEYGFCSFRGRVMAASRCERQGISYRLVIMEELSGDGLEGSDVEFYPDLITKTELSNAICLPILNYQETGSEKENQWTGPKKESQWATPKKDRKVVKSYVAGLVLQPTGEYRDEYRRLGIFRGSRGEFDVDQLEVREERLITII